MVILNALKYRDRFVNRNASRVHIDIEGPQIRRVGFEDGVHDMERWRVKMKNRIGKHQSSFCGREK